MKIFKLKKLLTLMTVTIVIGIAMLPIKASAVWKQSDSSNWKYIEGNTFISGWKSIDGSWYYFDVNGNMNTGWINDAGKWYFMQSSGAMKTGWINDGGKWYYTTSSGDMQTGWLSNNDAWYYLNASGAMQTGLVEVNSKTYYLSESGAMKTGNVTLGGTSYTFAASGEKVNPTNTNQIIEKPATPESTISATVSSGGSGGSGGSSGSSSGTTNSTSTTYKDLYGNWVIEKHIPSKIQTEYDDSTIDLGISLAPIVKVDSDSISCMGKTISKPTINEGTMTSSDFSSKYNDTFKNVGISGDKVHYVTVTQTDKPSNNITVFTADNGKEYALARGVLLEIKKQ